MPHTISQGTRLGPYEIQSLLGAGGMGEVYRARDSRLQRDVAVKILPRALAADQDRLKRFEREARAAGQLNHPNIMAVHDIGSTAGDGAGGGLHYIVCELLEGVTLRKKLDQGPIPPRKAIHYAIQTARGLAAAHAKGITHRDLKPENLMILAGDHVKILDFGLAKLLHAERTADDDTGPVAGTLTITGAILGTPSYMSPEQVRDQPTDHRTDIFALGAILYEMLTGRRAFDGASHADRMTAILTAEPPPLPEEIEEAAPTVGAIIAHCIEKSPNDRFDSANDLAFALSLAAGRPTARTQEATATATETTTTSLLTVPRDLPNRRVALREGAVHGARFAPDGKAVCYGGAWEGRPVEIFWTHPGNPESRALGGPRTDLLSIAQTGEMAISVRRVSRGGFFFMGMLARMPLGGGAPREIMDGVGEADFHPDGRRLAITREEGGMARIEFPAGNVVYQTAGWVSSIRFSRDGSRIAFLDHQARGSDSGCPAVVDMDGNVKKLSAVWSTSRGLAWSPDGREVVFAASNEGSRLLFAVDLDGAKRVVLGFPSNVTLKDISRQGDTLLTVENERMRTHFIGAKEGDARDLTWLDWTLLRGITDDGSRILFDETGQGGGELGSVYIRDTDGSPAIRLGDGNAFNLSPDGSWALASVGLERGRVDLIPCGAGEPRTIPTGDLNVDHASWFPDGRSICCLASEPGRARRLYKIDLATGKREPFSEEGITYYDSLVSPDGRFALAHAPGRKLTVYPVDGGASRPLEGAFDFERPVGWGDQGRAIYVFSRGELPVKVWRIELGSGARTLFREISPADATGVEGIATARMTPDGRTLAYSYYQRMSRMYTVEGLF
jgi:serine/threonine protein kinase/Tol biopolymer transport system component